MITVITLIGLAFRLVLANQSFWLDEGASLMAANVPLTQFFEYLKSDFHPPLYYLFLKLWLPLSGHSELIIRLPDILLGTATVPLLYFLGRHIFGKKSKLPLIMSLFLALNPFHIYYSQELRMYNLSSVFVLLSWLALLKNRFALVGLANLLSLFTFYGASFNFLAQGLYLLISDRKKVRSFLLSFIPLVVAFVFWWPVFSIQLINGELLKNALPGWQLLSGGATLKSLLLIPIKFILGRVDLEPQKLYFLVGGLLLLVFSGLVLISWRNAKSKPFWFWLTVPVVLATIISFKTPILGYWRYLYLLPAFVTLLALGVNELPQIWRRLALVFVCLVFVSANLYFWLTPRFQREDWRGFTAFVSGQKALVILPFTGSFAPLNFYTSDVTYFAAEKSLGQVPTDISVVLKPLLDRYQTVFVMDYLADLTDPQRQILDTVQKLRQKEKAVYNFNNLGQVYQF